MTEDRWPILDSHVLQREVADSSVLLDLKAEKYLGLDDTATEMLRVLGETKSFTEAVDELHQRYDTSRERIEHDLGAFIAELDSRGLLKKRAQDQSDQ